MSCKAEGIYIESNGIKLFTVVLLPDDGDVFPIIAMRSPYVDSYEYTDESDIVCKYSQTYKKYIDSGYAIVFQHCRGRGKSEGDCIPYINEREDSIALLNWIRRQQFYNGEIFLNGVSYLTSVWYVSAPFSNDIKGAVFGVQDYERYNICYRNGFLKKGLHGSWYVSMYKAKSHRKNNYTIGTFDTLPLKNFSKIVFGESVADFDEMLCSPDPDNSFWQTHNGGADARGATDNANIPILFTTGFYDIYTGGVFDMWNKLDADTKQKSALIVSPYNHGDDFEKEDSIEFPCGKRTEMFGNDYELEWFEYIRGKKEKSPFETGKVTYYRLFDNKWTTDSFLQPDKMISLKLGVNEISYLYNPYDPPFFKGGLSANFGGTVFQDKPDSRHDIISLYTEPFDKQTFVKGKMKAKLRVKSDCEDTCFYIRISIEKEKGDFGLRDDISSLCYQLGDYIPGEYVELDFAFDEHAFLVNSGERLRIDIASADNNHYVRHTNCKGLYSEQVFAIPANNTVDLNNSYLFIPVE